MPPSTSPEPGITTLTAKERQLVAAFRRLEPVQQRVLWNTLQHLASGVPGARLVLAVDR
jgi:hypothetical protein